MQLLKLIIEISPELAKKVNNLINQCKFESVSQFANIAFQNQFLLEESPKETLDTLEAKALTSETKSTKIQQSTSILAKPFAPESIRTMSPPESNKIPNDCLWGQYNRLFPIKITLRVLANILQENESIELSLLQTEAVNSAREIGLSLKKDDKKNRRKYGEMLASALPTGRSIQKTEKRFINHFVGYYTRAGRIEGAPGALKFLNIFEDEENKQQVGITEKGLKFAALSNPVLDEENYSKTLSKEESSFISTTFFITLIENGRLT